MSSEISTQDQSLNDQPGRSEAERNVMDINTLTLAEQNLRLEELNLKIEELRLKIKDQKKSDFKRLPTWTSIFAIVIALGGVLGQNILSNIKAESAQLELQKAENKKDSADRYFTATSKKLLQLKDSLNISYNNYDSLEKNIDGSIKELDSIKTLIASLEFQKKDSSKLKQIAKIISQTRTKLDSKPPAIVVKPKLANGGLELISNTRSGKILTELNVTVQSSDGNSPFDGTVTFYLPRTSSKPIAEIRSQNGKAILLQRISKRTIDSPLVIKAEVHLKDGQSISLVKEISY